MTPGTRPPELERWSTPTLCLAGDDDVYVPIKAMNALARVLNGSSLAEVPQTGHWTFLENSEIFNDIVIQFLREHLC